MKRKICALALAAAMSISLITTSALAVEVSFTDTSTHWAREAISQVVEKGLFNGTSADTFSPNVSMNRGMFVTVLGRFAESLGYTVSGTPSFTDVPADAYYARYVAWASDNGIVKGVSDDRFAPGDDVTREQMCTLFVRFLTFIGYPLPAGVELNFVDADSIHDWAVESVQIAVALGLVQGTQTAEGLMFRPAASATRAEVATVFLRQDALEGIHDLEPVETPPVDPVTPVDPAQPDVSGGGGGGGAGGGGGGTTPVNPKPQELTEAEKQEEAEIVGYLQSILDNSGHSDNRSYLSHRSQAVQDCANALLGYLRNALNDRNPSNGVYLTRSYVEDNYGSQMDAVKQQYKALNSDDQLDLKLYFAGLESTDHLNAVMSYFGVKV